MITLTLIAAVFSLALTLAIIWANPHRFSNQAFAIVTVVQTAWLACVYRATKTDLLEGAANSIQLEMWLRANAAVVSFLPATIWLLKNAIIYNTDRYKAIRGSTPVFVLGVMSIMICYSDFFIFRDSGDVLRRGIGYYIFSAIALIVNSTCIVQICGQMRDHRGIRRVELQFLALNFGGAALIIGALNALGNYFEVRAFNRFSVLIVFAASALTAWALLFHRVFNAREVFLRLSRRLSFALVLSGGIYAMWRATRSMLAEPFGLLVSIGLCSPIAVWLERRSRAWFDADGERRLAGR